jgi:hypothetical protein
MDQENVPMAVRQGRLGHSDPRTTMMYLPQWPPKSGRTGIVGRHLDGVSLRLHPRQQHYQNSEEYCASLSDVLLTYWVM